MLPSITATKSSLSATRDLRKRESCDWKRELHTCRAVGHCSETEPPGELPGTTLNSTGTVDLVSGKREGLGDYIDYGMHLGI